MSIDDTHAEPKAIDVGAVLKTRRKVHWTQRYKAKETFKAFNALFPVGTIVIYNGVRTRTECVAAYDRYWEPAVFLAGVNEPVPLALIEVPGYVQVHGKQRKK